LNRGRHASDDDKAHPGGNKKLDDFLEHGRSGHAVNVRAERRHGVELAKSLGGPSREVRLQQGDVESVSTCRG
jgi:hypothetical protein